MGRVMMAQWENKWISLSVLPVARVMIAQWENKWISLSVLPVARVMIAQWENKWISLSVLPVARVKFSAMTENFKGSFPGWSHALPGTKASHSWKSAWIKRAEWCPLRKKPSISWRSWDGLTRSTVNERKQKGNPHRNVGCDSSRRTEEITIRNSSYTINFVLF